MLVNHSNRTTALSLMKQFKLLVAKFNSKKNATGIPGSMLLTPCIIQSLLCNFLYYLCQKAILNVPGMMPYMVTSYAKVMQLTTLTETILNSCGQDFSL